MITAVKTQVQLTKCMITAVKTQVHLTK